MQRTQEILMVLLQKRLEGQQYIQQMKSISHEKNQIISQIEKSASNSLRKQLEQRVESMNMQIQYLQ